MFGRDTLLLGSVGNVVFSDLQMILTTLVSVMTIALDQAGSRGMGSFHSKVGAYNICQSCRNAHEWRLDENMADSIL